MSNAGAQVNNIAATNDIASGSNFITNTKRLSKDLNIKIILKIILLNLNQLKIKLMSRQYIHALHHH